MNSTDFDKLFKKVDNAVVQISYRWKIYRQLFDSGQENIDILNRRGSNVFNLLQKLIVDDVILSLARLTDPPGSSSNKNASFSNLLHQSRPHLEVKVYNEIDGLVAKLFDSVRPIRVYRNKVIAHSDLKHVLGKKILPSMTYDELEIAMESAREFMTRLHSALSYQSSDYDVLIQYGCDGSTLLAVLSLGNAARDAGEIVNITGPQED